MVDPHIHPEDTVALSKFTPQVRIWGYAFPDVFQICIKMDDISINTSHENRLACLQIIWMGNKEMGFRPSPIQISLREAKNS